MCAISAEQHTLTAESELLIKRLLRVAHAVIHVEDRRADLLLRETAPASIDQLVAVSGQAANCRAVADAATDLVVRVGAVRNHLSSPRDGGEAFRAGTAATV
jgi:hypothetical protein